MISAIVLTFNEEDGIEECLQTLKWADEIVILDEKSLDKTVPLAKKYTKNIFEYAGGKSFADKRNYALAKAKGDWVLFVDADERVTPELAEEIKAAVRKESLNGFYLKRKDFFMGGWLNHGETASVKFLRLAKRDYGQWVRPIHEVWEVKGETGELKNPLLHYSHPDLEEFTSKINTNTTLDTLYYFSRGEKFSLFKLLFFPKAKFLRNYFLKLGFLDGKRGLIMALVMSFNSFLIRAKLLELYLKRQK